MAQQPKRIPGERNPEPDPSEVDHLVNISKANAVHGAGVGLGAGGIGVVSGVRALVGWRKRRQAKKALAARIAEVRARRER